MGRFATTDGHRSPPRLQPLPRWGRLREGRGRGAEVPSDLFSPREKIEMRGPLAPANDNRKGAPPVPPREEGQEGRPENSPEGEPESEACPYTPVMLYASAACFADARAPRAVSAIRKLTTILICVRSMSRSVSINISRRKPWNHP